MGHVDTYEQTNFDQPMKTFLDYILIAVTLQILTRNVEVLVVP